MTVIITISAILLILALLRLGIMVEYGKNGFKAWAQVGFLLITIYPEKVKRVKKVKEKKKTDMMPGSLKEFLDILPPIKNMLSRLRRKLLIKRLEIHYTAASKDPSNTAMIYGTANAAVSLIVPFLEEKFKIKNRDIQIFADFESEEQKIYVKTAITIAVWEVFYIAFALLPLFKIIKPKRPDINKPQKMRPGKEVRENG